MAKQNAQAQEVSIIPSRVASIQTSIRGTMNRAVAKWRLEEFDDSAQAYELLRKDVDELGVMLGHRNSPALG